MLLLIACTGGVDVNPFFIKTSDGVKISANFYPAESDKGIILLHMLDHDKSDWQEFIPMLEHNGYNVIAIDMRGHGMSEFDWQSMSGVELGRAVLDVDAARVYLEEKGVTRFGVVGASIGANIALKHASQDTSIKSIVLLSPSLNYRNVETVENIAVYDRAIFVSASKDDFLSVDDSLTLYAAAIGTKKFMLYDGDAHGTALLDSDLPDVIIKWLDDTV